MMRLEELREGLSVRGVISTRVARIEKVTPFGNLAVQVAYRDANGVLREALLYREDEGKLYPAEAESTLFSANAEDFKLAAEAQRIGLAYLFDPYTAIRTSTIEPLPHQITAVYQEMLPKLPLRFVLADDPGAGKTVMAGLLIKEMLIRGDLKRCLIVCPGGLCEQWQDELRDKFGLSFIILTNDLFEAALTRNAFNEHALCIARLDKLARDEDVKAKLRQSNWDLVVCDEAHKMSAQYTGGEAKYTKRYQLGQLLGEITENLLLMTATPHNGKPMDFQLFMALVDPDRFGVSHGGVAENEDVSDVMRRLVKEELLKFDGTALFPERKAFTVSYELSGIERDLYESVTRYVSQEFNRADRLDGKRRNSVGFALTSLQRRLASSPESIYQSLKRRRKRLESQLDNLKRGRSERDALCVDGAFYEIEGLDDDFDADELSASALEDMEASFVDSASASETIAELEAEIATLRSLELKADRLRDSGKDRKWEELSRLLQDDGHMFDGEGARVKLIIFTEHRDTLNYLSERVSSLLGDVQTVVTIHGGMRRDDRRSAQTRFTQDRRVRVLIATDAAGEGINLQRAHLMINYDLPWNPNRLEQRFGRIHRIGQTEVCYLWNLVASDTREGQVFERLFSKLNEEREALGGKVFDVLGRVSFGEKSLRDLLVEAVRRGDDPAVRARLNQVVDTAFDPAAVKKLIEDYALTDEFLDPKDVLAVKEDMERAEARKLEPHFIGSFFVTGIKRLGGRIARREFGRYEIARLPKQVTVEAERLGFDGVGGAYERIAFNRDGVAIPDFPVAEYVAPGTPLLEALREAVNIEVGDSLTRGSVLIDDSDWGEDPRLLVVIETAIRDDVPTRTGEEHIASKSLSFVELSEKGEARSGGYAPYLDYRAPTEGQRVLIDGYVTCSSWIDESLETRAMGYALERIVPEELRRARELRAVRIDKVARAVDQRLTAEVRYWDARAAELKQKEDSGKVSARLNSANAAVRAEELSSRRERRLNRLAQERELTSLPPRVLGKALIIPRGLMCRLSGQEIDPSQRSARKLIEAVGMHAVMSIERSLGHEPRDVSADNVGYDIESHVPVDKGNALLLIEVKARAEGADTVTVSRNEVLCALNKREGYVLALVEVGSSSVRTTYLAHPFSASLDVAADAVTYSIKKLLAQGKVLLQREEVR